MRKLTEEEEVRSRMTNEFDERLAQRPARAGMRSQDVQNGEERKEQPYPDHFQALQHHILAPEARKTFVPDGSQQLLYVRVRYKLQKYQTIWLSNLLMLYILQQQQQQKGSAPISLTAPQPLADLNSFFYIYNQQLQREYNKGQTGWAARHSS